MTSNLRVKDGEVQLDTDNFRDGTNLSPTCTCKDTTKNTENLASLSDLGQKTKKKKASRYSKLSKRFSALEEMLQTVLSKS